MDEDDRALQWVEVSLSSTNGTFYCFGFTTGLKFARHNDLLDANQVVEKRG